MEGEWEIRQRCVDHILDRLASTPPTLSPFPHFWLDAFLPTDVFERLLDEAPDQSLFEGSLYGNEHARRPGQIKDGSVNRFAMGMSDAKLGCLPPATEQLWRGVRNAMGSPRVKQAVFEKLSHGLAHRFRIADHEAGDIEGYPRIRLMRESVGYGIKPHTDGRRKLVTLQLAMPCDESQIDLGTSLYRISTDPRHMFTSPRGFQEVMRYPFLPNSVFSFAVVNTMRIRSWHGRPPLEAGCGVRNTLLQVYYAQRSEGDEDVVREFYGEQASSAAFHD